MTTLLTRADMRSLEQVAIDSGRVTGFELMERAGAAVCDAIFAHWPALAHSSYRALVMCGPGNNGGDGFVIARLLKQRGWQVSVLLYGDPDHLAGDARKAYDSWRSVSEAEDQVLPVYPEDQGQTERDPDTYDLAIDAIFGSGLRDGLSFIPAVYRGLCADPPRPPLVAVDMPSGIDMDTGQPGWNGFCTYADLTVTFHSPKLGQYLADGPAFCGAVAVKSIGLEHWDTPEEPEPTLTDLVGAPVGVLKSDETLHKYAHGHALVLSGSSGQGGAARLAARGALRIGAGLVTVVCPSAALAENAAQLTAVMLSSCDRAADLTDMLLDARVTCLCLGPGLGTHDHARALVTVALRDGRPVVLDADAISAFQSEPATLLDMLHPKVCLTPHFGEFARVFPDLAGRMKEDDPDLFTDRLSAVESAARKAGCTVLLKGPDTVIADGQGLTALHGAVYDRSAPWLATAGSGDVLAGFVTGLMARGWDPFEAAKAASWLHVECARSFGPGLIAEDLPEELPKVLRALLI